jgi:hypothetical protein
MFLIRYGGKEQQQIPFRDDTQKGKCNCKSRSSALGEG